MITEVLNVPQKIKRSYCLLPLQGSIGTMCVLYVIQSMTEKQ